MKPYSRHLDILRQIQKNNASSLLRKHQLNCESSDWLDCAVLKLQKKSWSDGGMAEGIFFSVWVGEKELKKNRFNYNIHALKLRLRKGYAIASREFACSFRARLAGIGAAWPNLSVDCGPQTLLRGWVALNLKTFELDVSEQLDRFIAIHLIIDELLDERKIV